MDGEALITQLAGLTGLPQEWVSRELTKIIEARGLDPKHITLMDLREALATFMQDVLVEAKAALNK